jgi:UDP-N-acetylmuramoylalanine--D-glutamate ligase
MGLGKSGLSAARALLASGAHVTAWDDSAVARARAAAEGVPVADLTTIDLTEMAALILSPGIPHTHPAPHPVAARAKEKGVPILGDVELWALAETRARSVAITGTNGKSTTTALVGHMLVRANLAVQVGGNLGTPLLDLAPLGQDGVYVLEMSSYQLELAPSLAPDVAVLLNISPDHLGRHGGMEGYVAAKKRIFAWARPGATAVVGIDDPFSARIHQELLAAGRWRVMAVAVGKPVRDGAFVADGRLVMAAGGHETPLLAVAEMTRLRGAHNWQNAAAAVAVGAALGLAPEQMARALSDFSGLAHRQEEVASVGAVTFVNDSKATNAEAAARALAAYDEIFWIAGGRPKEDGLGAALPLLERVRAAFLIGEAAHAFAVALEGRVPVTISNTLDRAVEDAYRAAATAARRGARPVVLLSPACASFDQFDNFEARGDAFRALVRKLCEKVA